MSARSVETKLEAPTSRAEGRRLRQEAAQAYQEINAALSTHNQERPPKSRSVDLAKWTGKRSRLIHAKGRAEAAVQFYKQWLIEAESTRFSVARGSLNAQLHDVARGVKLLEELYAAVGRYLDDDSEAAYTAMQEIHEGIETQIDESTKTDGTHEA